MGCDIHVYAERKSADGWEEVVLSNDDLEERSYGTFGFLADVRNYSGITPISEPRGIPDDASAVAKEDYDSWNSDAHSASWLTLRELLAFDYDAIMEDRRVTRRVSAGYMSGAETCDPGEGQKMTYREFLGSSFFSGLEGAREAGAERLVFWFDN